MTSTPPPRRQRLSPEARREQLMTAAVTVLAAQGYAGASAELIASTAGVSKGLLWHYFADRDDLFDATARRTLVVLRTAVASSVDLTAPAPVLLRAAIVGAAAVLDSHADERRALNEIILGLRRPDGSLRLGLDDFDETYAAQEAIFQRGQSEGDFREGLDPRVLAVAYQGAVDGMLGYLEAHPELDRAEFAASVADALLGGMVRRAS